MCGLLGFDGFGFCVCALSWWFDFSGVLFLGFGLTLDGLGGLMVCCFDCLPTVRFFGLLPFMWVWVCLGGLVVMLAWAWFAWCVLFNLQLVRYGLSYDLYLSLIVML